MNGALRHLLEGFVKEAARALAEDDKERQRPHRRFGKRTLTADSLALDWISDDSQEDRWSDDVKVRVSAYSDRSIDDGAIQVTLNVSSKEPECGAVVYMSPEQARALRNALDKVLASLPEQK